MTQVDVARPKAGTAVSSVNALGRFNEAADPQMALAARAERPRVLTGLHDSAKWPGIPTS
jgi:hypothetical protein